MILDCERCPHEHTHICNTCKTKVRTIKLLKIKFIEWLRQLRRHSIVSFTPAYQSYFSAGDEAEPYCSHCDNKVEDDFKYCPDCGYKLDWDYWERMEYKSYAKYKKGERKSGKEGGKIHRWKKATKQRCNHF